MHDSWGGGWTESEIKETREQMEAMLESSRAEAGRSSGRDRCRGSWSMGNNCGRCPHCLDTAHEGVGEIRRLRSELLAWRERAEKAESSLRGIRAGLGDW